MAKNKCFAKQELRSYWQWACLYNIKMILYNNLFTTLGKLLSSSFMFIQLILKYKSTIRGSSCLLSSPTLVSNSKFTK